MLAIATDFAASQGSPRPHVRALAEAGFSHIHWCHHWCTDFVYGDSELSAIQDWLREYHLELLDLHGSMGVEKCWSSPHEWERRAGVELVVNRVQMTAELGGGAVIMHFPRRAAPGPAEETGRRWDSFRRSLDELVPVCRQNGIRIAVENMPGDDVADFNTLFAAYDNEFLGLCYDSGHGNMPGDGQSLLEALKERLIAVHLHDNDGVADQHRIPFDGTLDWRRLVSLIAASAYDKPLTLEVGMGTYGEETDITDFLGRAFEAGHRLTAMVGYEKKAREA